MSLLVWMPFNNNDDINLGLVDGKRISGTPKYDIGKMGSSLKISNNLNYQFSENLLKSSNEKFSYSFWIKTTSNLSNILLAFAKTQSNSATFYTFPLPNYAINQTYLNQWVHIAAVREINNNIYFYINGVKLESEYAGMSISDLDYTKQIYFFKSSSESIYLSDFRFYNHSLSLKEIDEIRKGLIFHYSMNMPNGIVGGENLALGTNKGQENWYYSQSNGSHTTEDDGQGVKFNVSQPSTSWQMVTYSLFTSVLNSIEKSTSYTVSFDLKSTTAAGKSIRCGILNPNATNYMASITAATENYKANDQWQKMIIHLTTNSTFKVSNQVIYITGLNLIGEHSFKNLKLEKGSAVTPWTPALEDIGGDKLIVYDESGYGHNGSYTAASKPGWAAGDTPIGEGSYKWTSSASYILSDNFCKTNATFGDFTASIWFKTNTLNDTAPNLISIGQNTGFRFRIASSNQIWYYIRIGSTQCAATFTASKTLTDNTWHLATATFKAGVVTIYIDGVNIGSTDYSSTGTVITFAATQLVLGGCTASSEKFLGSLCDAKIYATALSAEDVKKLYQVRQAIDKAGNIYCDSFIEGETGKVSYTSTGLIKASEVGAGLGRRNYADYTSTNYTSFSSFSGVQNTCPSLGRVYIPKGAKVGDILTVSYDYKYDNITAASGKTASYWIQGSGDVTGWSSGSFSNDGPKTFSGSGTHHHEYNITLSENQLKNAYWYITIRHDYVQSGTVGWKNFKVEWGKKATSWVPSTTGATVAEQTENITVARNYENAVIAHDLYEFN